MAGKCNREKRWQTILIAVLMVVCTSFAQAQEQNTSMVNYSFSYTGDVLGNMAGGIKQGGGFLGKGRAAMELNTENAGWWKGGTFLLSGATTHGIAAQEKWVGEYQSVDNIDAGGAHIYLESLCFSQSFDFIEFTLGVHAYDDVLGVHNTPNLFTNASFGINPLPAINAGVPTFPLTALGMTATWHINDNFSWTVSAFDTPLDFEEGNTYNTKWRVGTHGYTVATEVGYENAFGDKELKGTYKATTFYQTKEYNWGLHISLEQEICKHNNRVLSLFALGAYAPDKENNELKTFVAGGVHYAGLFSAEGKDEVGLAASSVRFDIGGGIKTETIFELTYKYQLNDNISLQPDLQYVINPSGGLVDDAFVGIMRFGIAF